MKFKSKKQKEQSSEKSNYNEQQNDLKFIDKRTKSYPKKVMKTTLKKLKKEFSTFFLDKETARKLPKTNLQKMQRKMQQQLILLQKIAATEASVIQLKKSNHFISFLFNLIITPKQKSEDKNNQQNNNDFDPESNDDHKKILTKNLEINESIENDIKPDHLNKPLKRKKLFIISQRRIYSNSCKNNEHSKNTKSKLKKIFKVVLQLLTKKVKTNVTVKTK